MVCSGVLVRAHGSSRCVRKPAPARARRQGPTFNPTAYCDSRRRRAAEPNHMLWVWHAAVLSAGVRRRANAARGSRRQRCRTDRRAHVAGRVQRAMRAGACTPSCCACDKPWRWPSATQRDALTRSCCNPAQCNSITPVPPAGAARELAVLGAAESILTQPFARLVRHGDGTARVRRV